MSFEEDLGDPDLPELAHEHLCLVHKVLPPGCVPIRDLRVGRTHHKNRATESVEGRLVVTWRQQPTFVEGWDHMLR